MTQQIKIQIIQHADGGYTIVRLTPQQVRNLHAQGCPTSSVDESVLEAWQAHVKQGAVFTALWCSLAQNARGAEKCHFASCTGTISDLTCNVCHST